MEISPIKRDIFDEIVKYIDTQNIIVLHGARQVGKTHILYYLNNYLKNKNMQVCFIDLEDSRFVDLLNEGVDSLIFFLKGENFDLNKKIYLLIDEIQYLENPSPLLKLLVDHHQYLQLVVSGSSSFDIKTKFTDSLVGRTVNFEVHNLSFFEFLRFKKTTFDPKNIRDEIHLGEIKNLYHEYMLYGGYPKVVLENSVDIKEKYLQQIVDTYVRKDIRDLAHVKDIQKFNNLLKILASQSGGMLDVTGLSKLCSVAKQTIESYLFILENTYIIKLLSPYSSNAKVEIVKSPKIFFYDTGLLQMLWFKKLVGNIVGNVFETSVFAELVKKYGVKNLYYWRNKNQNEIDFILNINDHILPIEVKTSFSSFKKRSISNFCEKYNVENFKVVGIEGEKKNSYDTYPWEI